METPAFHPASLFGTVAPDLARDLLVLFIADLPS
jgi:hypothetical protein